MSCFIYFAVGHSNPISRDELRQWGLSYAFESSPADASLCSGPTGRAGTLFADVSRLNGKSLTYADELQKWDLCLPAASDRPEIQIGYYTDAKPTADDLARAEQLAGDRVVLGDGRKWLVPKGRCWQVTGGELAVTTSLERTRRYDPIKSTWYFEEVAERHKPIWEITEAFAEVIAEQNRLLRDAIEKSGDSIGPEDELHLQLTENDVLEKATQILGFNYRVGPMEASLLGLFDRDGVAQEVMLTLIDHFTFCELAQKKTASASDGSNSCSGQAGDGRIIGQQQQTAPC